MAARDPQHAASDGDLQASILRAVHGSDPQYAVVDPIA
jgi:hypothetical protein